MKNRWKEPKKEGLNCLKTIREDFLWPLLPTEIRFLYLQSILKNDFPWLI